MTSLTLITGYAELLLNQAAAGEQNIETQKEMLGIILAQAKELEPAIDALLDMGKLLTREQLVPLAETDEVLLNIWQRAKVANK